MPLEGKDQKVPKSKISLAQKRKKSDTEFALNLMMDTKSLKLVKR